jgi:hypothetical protein
LGRVGDCAVSVSECAIPAHRTVAFRRADEQGRKEGHAKVPRRVGIEAIPRGAGVAGHRNCYYYGEADMRRCQVSRRQAVEGQRQGGGLWSSKR